MLVRFLRSCTESRQLYRQFFFSIYTPLHQLFADERAASIEKELERILKQWSCLLVPGPIDHRMLSPESSEAVYDMKISNKPRDTRFNLILRLVPDFAVKGYKALFLARQWRNMLGSSGYWRELKFIHSKRQWALRPELSDSSVCSSTFHKLEKELTCFGEGEMTESKGRVIGIGDRTASRDYEVLGTNMKFHSLRETDERFPYSTSFTLDTNKQRRELSRIDLKRKQVKVPRIKTKILNRKQRSRYTAEETVEEPLLHTSAVTWTKCWGSGNGISKEKQQNTLWWSPIFEVAPTRPNTVMIRKAIARSFRIWGIMLFQICMCSYSRFWKGRN